MAVGTAALTTQYTSIREKLPLKFADERRSSVGIVRCGLKAAELVCFVIATLARFCQIADST
jgi:hypothetical protein